MLCRFANGPLLRASRWQARTWSKETGFSRSTRHRLSTTSSDNVCNRRRTAASKSPSQPELWPRYWHICGVASRIDPRADHIHFAINHSINGVGCGTQTRKGWRNCRSLEHTAGAAWSCQRVPCRIGSCRAKRRFGLLAFALPLEERQRRRNRRRKCFRGRTRIRTKTAKREDERTHQ